MKLKPNKSSITKFAKRFNKSVIRTAIIIGKCTAQIEESNRRIDDMMRQLKKAK